MSDWDKAEQVIFTRHFDGPFQRVTVDRFPDVVIFDALFFGQADPGSVRLGWDDRAGQTVAIHAANGSAIYALIAEDRITGRYLGRRIDEKTPCP